MVASSTGSVAQVSTLIPENCRTGSFFVNINTEKLSYLDCEGTSM